MEAMLDYLLSNADVNDNDNDNVDAIADDSCDIRGHVLRCIRNCLSNYTPFYAVIGKYFINYARKYYESDYGSQIRNRYKDR